MKKTPPIIAQFTLPKNKTPAYNRRSLLIGRKIESEHTGSPIVQDIIAKNHLDEDPNYYDKLKVMEKVSYKPKVPRGTLNPKTSFRMRLLDRLRSK